MPANIPQADVEGQKYDPRGYDGKPRQLSREHRALLDAVQDAMLERVSSMTGAEQEELKAACFSVSPINCGWNQFSIANLVYWHVFFELPARAALKGDGNVSPTGKE